MSAPIDTFMRWPPAARLAYQDAIKAGLSTTQATDFAASQYGESGFNPNAVNKKSGAAGLYQLLSSGYVNKANQLGGVFNPEANIQAILPNYASDYRSHPFEPGAAAARVEASGQPASYYAEGWQHLDGAVAPAAAASTPAAAATPAAQIGQPNLAQPDLQAARASLASFLIGNLQQHGHSDPAALVGELQQLKPLITPQPVAAATTVQPSAPGTTPEPPAASMGASAKPDAAPGLNLAAVPDAIATRAGIEVDASILPSVSRIAQAFGVKANSGYRSPEHNAAVGGAENSDHLHGGAVDFVGPPDALAELHAWAEGKFPYVEPMSQARDHVHISFIR